MNLLDAIRADSVLFTSIVFFLCLFIGSFLNVVIHRLPIMMNREWKRHCFELEEREVPEEAVFNLMVPRSNCPHCGHQISALENIPLLSFVFLRGRCRNCGAGISFRYPLVELLTAVLSAVVVWNFGFTPASFFALLFSWSLIALAFIDIDHQLLPDSISLPLLWTGLLANIGNLFTPLQSAVIGAIAGYLSLWLIYHVFKLITGKEGMGFGDFKLFAAIGAWLGWSLLPLIILLSSLVGALTGITMILLNRTQRGSPIPFGPFLAAAGWIAMLWGTSIVTAYFGFLGQ